MADLRTQPTGKSVTAFLRALEDPQARKDCKAIAAIMRSATSQRPRMWGPSLIGYGRYHYNNTQGAAVWPVTGYSPRKREMVVYVMPGFSAYQGLLKKLGKHRIGKSCLYFRRLADIDTAVLEELVCESVDEMRTRYRCD